MYAGTYGRVVYVCVCVCVCVKQNQKAQSEWNSKMLDTLAKLLETAKKENMSTPQSAQKPVRSGTLRELSQSRIDPSDLNEVGVAFHYRQEDTNEQLLAFAENFLKDIKKTQRYVGVTGYDAKTKHLSLGANNQNRFYEHLTRKRPRPNRMDVLKVFENKKDALKTEAYLHKNLTEKETPRMVDTHDQYCVYLLIWKPEKKEMDAVTE